MYDYLKKIIATDHKVMQCIQNSLSNVFPYVLKLIVYLC